MDNTAYTSFNPLQNLKAFVTSRPPLLVFLICMVTFATTAISFAYFVKRADLKNPDVPLDWNGLLENFAKVEFCIHNNGSSGKPNVAYDISQETNPVESTTMDFQSDVITESDIDAKNDGDNVFGNHSLSVYVSFMFGSEIQKLSPNVTAITGFMCGRFLGFTGVYASHKFRVTLDLPSDRNFEKCKGRKGCVRYHPVCVTFHGLPRLPNTRKMKICPSVDYGAAINLTSFSVPQCPTGEEWFFDSVETVSPCHGLSLHVVYKSNPDWSVMLTEHDRTLINLHLMYTSYFLLVMVMTLLCYAIIRGRPKSKVYMPEKVIFDN